MRNMNRDIGLCVLLHVVSIFVVAGLAVLGPVGPEAPGVEPAWLDSVTDEIARFEYHVSRTPQGPQAPNRAQDFRTYFRRDGIEVVPRRADGPSWRFAWQTAGWGRGRETQSLAPVEPTLDGARVEYVRDGLTEWYENGEDGVEQGFTIDGRPPGDGELRIEGRIGALLYAELDASGNAVDFYTAEGGAHVLRYEKLEVWDADGRDLPARMNLHENLVALVVNDAEAKYPITIDPVLNAPVWTIVEPQPDSDFGASVSTAGDVNGDGYSDVLVGAPSYDAGETDEGRAFLYLGSPTGLESTPAWTFDGDQIEAFCGFCVGPAGDVNGDGYDDVIVGAYGYDDTQTDEGRACAFYGSASGLSASPDWVADGEQAEAGFGYAAETAGDVNGDGYADVVVTAPYYDAGEEDEGRAFVYLGSAEGLAASPHWTAESDQANARFGVSAGTAGDVQADGYADVIVGSDLFDNGNTDEGLAFVYHGSATGLSSSWNWFGEGSWTGANFGRSVSTAGDVNGDGYSDVIIGAPKYARFETDEGRIEVYLGSATGLENSPVFAIETNHTGAELGQAVGTAGDLDGDGRSEVIAGAPGFDVLETDDGIVFVYKWDEPGTLLQIWAGSSLEAGGRSGEAVGTTGDTDGDGYAEVIAGAPGVGRASVNRGFAGTLSPAIATLDGNAFFAHLGVSVATAGDVNGDGYADVIVGADGFNAGNGGGQGKVFVYHGSAAGISALPAWTATGDHQIDYFGSSVATAGDVNGDGFSDVIIGAPGYTNEFEAEGAAFVYHGSPTGLEASPSWAEYGGAEATHFGSAVAGAGDVNGDGFSDVIIGAHDYENGETREGAAFAYHGSPTGLGQVVWTVEGNQITGQLGNSVGTAGDVNGDGFSDVIVGMPYYDNGETDEGATFVFHGSADGLNPSFDWFAEGNQTTAYFGTSVSTAGDVNGDGFSDVIVGAYYADNGQPVREGMAFIYLGSGGGLGSTAAWSDDGNQETALFGYSVGTAGDINGDGYSDVLVGAPLFDSGQVDEGKAFLYLGKATGLSLASSPLEGNQDDAELGSAVATAGDINGDGFSDVIVGAPQYDDGETDEGRAFVYLGNHGGGLVRSPGQHRTDDSAPIASRGVSDSPSSFLLKVLGRSPGGRDRVRIQVEVKPLGAAFDGAGLLTGPEEDTGLAGTAAQLSQLVTGLAPETPYHWRLRVLTTSPFFPRSPWLWMDDNAVTETDLRTAPVPTAVEDPYNPFAGVRLASPSPNPFRATTEFAFTLENPGRVRLSVYDVAGREVARLAGGRFDAGGHVITWDGTAAGGTRAAAGTYFARLRTERGSDVRKVTLAQ